MNSIYGLSLFNGTDEHVQTLGNKQMEVMHHWKANSEANWNDERCFIGQLSASGKDGLGSTGTPIFHESCDLAIVTAASLFNHEDLLQSFKQRPDATVSDAELILMAYEKWGIDCPTHLNGGFAFAIWDKSEKQLFCARDQHGIKPFYFSHNENGFAFASELRGLLCLPFVADEPDEIWIADFLCRIWLDKERTLYKDIRRLKPAHSLLVKDGSIKTWQYWTSMPKGELKLASESEYIEGFKEKLQKAVEVRCQPNNAVATELSGGLDSSAVTALAQKFTGKATPYSYVLTEENRGLGLFDEENEIKHICQFLGIEHHELLTDTGLGLMPAIEWNNRIQDEPPKEMNCMFRDSLYALVQKSGARTILSGFGGDDTVSYHGSGYLEELVKQRKYLTASTEAWQFSKEHKKSFPKKMLSLLRYGITQKMDFVDLNSPVSQKLQFRPILDELFERVNMLERFIEYQKLYARTGNFLLDQQRRLTQPHLMYRLEMCDHATRSFGLEYRYPLLDIELIEYYMSLPLHLKVQKGRGRYVFRKAVEGLLPDDIIWRHSKQGSSNPQIIERAKVDGDEVQKLLSTIYKNNPINRYADFEKSERGKREIARQRGRTWNSMTTDIMNLLLAKRLSK